LRVVRLGERDTTALQDEFDHGRIVSPSELDAKYFATDHQSKGVPIIDRK
jgi:hypothetical protein